jgi:putative hydrolase of the HAD superfamily
LQESAVEARGVIKIVLLDIGNVLLEVNWQNAIKALGLKDVDSILKIHDGPIYDKFERDQISEREFFESIKAELQLKHSFLELRAAWNSILEDEVPGVANVLEKYKSQVTYYALTNSNRTHIESEIKNFKVFGFIKKIFTSYELKCRKPEPEIYKKVLKELKCQPQEILFLDDKPENIQAALAEGFCAERCENSAQQMESIIKKYLIK